MDLFPGDLFILSYLQINVYFCMLKPVNEINQYCKFVDPK